MDNPQPRFTGIFLPAEILEIQDLSLFEMILLSWIDALYCEKRGGCFASNEYLGTRLRGAKENTVAKALTKLRNLGLIEDVSFDGRQRVIRATISKYVDKAQSKAALDKNPIQSSIGQKSNAKLDKNPSTTKNIHIERKEESTTTREPPPSKPPKSKEPPEKVVVVSPIFSNLKISPSKKKYLQSMYTTPQIEKAVDRVKRWDSRRSDEAALEYALQNEDSWNDIMTKNEMVEKNRQFCKRLAPFDMKQVGGMYCSISLHGVEFSKGNASKFFSMEEEGFIHSIEDFLLKCGVPIPIEGDL